MSGRESRIVILTAPSGSGKTTIARRVMDLVPELQFSVSATTRPRRSHEREGVDYYYVDRQQFQTYIDSGELLEFEEVYPGRFYGTLRSEVDRKSKAGPVLLDIDVRGALTVKQLFGDDAYVIFLRPPSVKELERRLQRRATEDATTIRTRLDRAQEELQYENQFDAVIVNDDLESAVSETLARVREFLKG